MEEEKRRHDIANTVMCGDACTCSGLHLEWIVLTFDGSNFGLEWIDLGWLNSQRYSLAGFIRPMEWIRFGIRP